MLLQDWFSQKNCALQYDMLLETIAQPKRKRGDKGDLIEKPGEEILKKLKVRMLTQSCNRRKILNI